MKHKLFYGDYCLDEEKTIDGEKIVTEDGKEHPLLKEIIKTMIDRLDYSPLLEDFFRELIMEMGEFKDLGQCEECGTYNEEYTYTIEA